MISLAIHVEQEFDSIVLNTFPSVSDIVKRFNEADVSSLTMADMSLPFLRDLISGQLLFTLYMPIVINSLGDKKTAECIVLPLRCATYKIAPNKYLHISDLLLLYVTCVLQTTCLV